MAFYQRGAVVSQKEAQALSGGTATSFTAVSLAAIVPPTATSAVGYAGVAQSSGSAQVSGSLAPEGSGTTPTYGYQFLANHAGTTFLYSPFDLLLSTAQQLKYYVSGANAQMNAYCQGWRY